MHQTSRCVLFSIGCYFLLLVSFPTFAQQSTEDVLYLKNGWVLRGKITSTVIDSTVSLQTYDRNRFVFSRQEIDSVRQEVLQPTAINTIYKRRGFNHYTELGVLAGKNTSNWSPSSAFSFQTVNGYKFGQWLFVGVGIGIDLYATQTILPAFGSLRGDFISRGRFIPYYFLDVGYGSNITGSDSQIFVPTNITHKGGTLYAIGLGMKVIFANNTGFLLSVGHHSQQSSMHQDFGGGNTNIREMNYQRVAIRAGFTF
ncbi:MAG: hypothetical protein V4714_09190 [Bacteroidota bacterium]